MKQEEIRDKLEARFGADVILAADTFREQMTVTVAAEKIVPVCRFLRDDPDLAFDFLSFVGGVDRFDASPRFEVVYQLHSLKLNHRFRIKAHPDAPESDRPAIDSVAGVWTTADWHERETAEMFGITFRNHPDPRKLLLPEEWTVHPLRKDFPLEGTDADTPDLPQQRAIARESGHAGKSQS